MKLTSVLCLTLGACGRMGAQTTSDSIDWGERWNNYVERTFDWKKIGMVTAETAFDQTFRWNRCGRPPFCFPHEIGGALVGRTARTTAEFGMGAVLHEDLRRRPSNLNGFRRRVTYALMHAPLAKNPEGEWRPAYGRFAGSFAEIAVGTAWRGRPITTERMAQGMVWSFSAYFEDALWAEFEPEVKRMGRRMANRVGLDRASRWFAATK